MPTFGLLITSLLSPQDFSQEGWWQVFTEPSKLTWDNYDAVLSNENIRSALWTTVLVAVGGTVLPIAVAALAGYAFAWLEFPDAIALHRCHRQRLPTAMALIPMFRFYNDLGIFDTVLSLVLFHTAFTLFAIFLLRNFFIGIPEGPDGGGADRRRSEIRIFLRLILPLGLPAIASLAIFQFLGSGTTRPSR